MLWLSFRVAFELIIDVFYLIMSSCKNHTRKLAMAKNKSNNKQSRMIVIEGIISLYSCSVKVMVRVVDRDRVRVGV